MELSLTITGIIIMVLVFLYDMVLVKARLNGLLLSKISWWVKVGVPAGYIIGLLLIIFGSFI